MAAVQAGSRWLHDMPDENQVKDWFRTQPLHREMQHEPYFGGIVIISATEKYKVSREKAGGGTFVQENERAVFTPYVKVDTRISYFWNYVDVLNITGAPEGKEYIGVIEPVPQRVITNQQSSYYNEHLPEGMFMYPVRNNANDSVNRYVGARWRVAIYERESYAKIIAGQKATPILQGQGTKQTLMARAYADDNAIMKAETGAIGRALGVAGILVVGTGVATAEDMQELATPGGQAGAGGPESAVLPPEEAGPGQRVEGPDVDQGQMSMGPAVEEAPTPQEEDDALRTRARELSSELQTFPEAFAAYKDWYQKDRGFPALDQLSGPALKGAVVKLERALDEARGGSG